MMGQPVWNGNPLQIPWDIATVWMYVKILEGIHQTAQIKKAPLPPKEIIFNRRKREAWFEEYQNSRNSDDTMEG